MSTKKLHLLSHASLLIEIGQLKLLTDPWFLGTAFNSGWSLSPTPDLKKIESVLGDIDVIWISHEHPDHLHFPTLRHIRSFLPERVKVAFQDTNSEKVFDALEKLGYKNFLKLPHMQKVRLNQHVEIAVYAHRHLDSSLAIFDQGRFWALNINDTELNQNDLSLIHKNFGSPDILMNQFSIAGSEGIPDLLALDAKQVLRKMIEHHKALGASFTVPFASLVTFSKPDNDHMNSQANTVFDALSAFKSQGLKLVLLEIQGEPLVWEKGSLSPRNVEEIHTKAEQFYRSHYEQSTEETDPLEPPKDRTEVQSVVEKRVVGLKKKTSPLLFQQLKPFRFKVTDWDDEIWELDFHKVRFSKVQNSSRYDIKINSQPLWFAFKMPFGVQTLGVSGRYLFHPDHTKIPTTWKLFRILTSLENAEIYLSLQGILSRPLLRWLWQRRSGIMSQVVQQYKRFSS